MKNKFKYLNIIITIFAVSFLFSFSDSKAQTPNLRELKKERKTYAEGQILVKYKNTIGISRQMASINRMGDMKIRRLRNSNLMHVKLKQGLSVKEAVKEYKKNPLVEYAQPNYIYYKTSVPNDPGYSELWGLKNTGQEISEPSYTDREGNFIKNPGTPGMDMNLERAWDEITDCGSVVVAVVDTGINYEHEDLADNMWDGSSFGFPNHGYDFFDGDNDPMDLDGHGSHVAGTIGAIGNNSIGSTGICWNVQLMALKVFGSSGEGALTHQVLDAIIFAADKGANVINMSLGVESEFDQAFSDAIQYAADRDVLVVVAAGNGGYDQRGDNNDAKTSGDKNPNTQYYPCNFSHENLLCVAALEQDYKLTYFSNYGTTSVDTAAPGANVRSSYFGTSNQFYDDYSTGWTKWSADPGDVNNWGLGKYKQYGYDIQFLGFPYNYDGYLNLYENNSDSYYYKNFGEYASDTDALIVSLATMFDLDKDSDDSIYLSYINSDEHPFGENGEVLAHYTGSSGDLSGSGYYPHFTSFNLSPKCLGYEDCTFGFRFKSDSTGVSKGAAFYMFLVSQKNIGNEYLCADGTSMATPHVTGLAALIKAYNPEYRAVDIAESINNGGDEIVALKYRVKSKRAADAWGSITYISKPKNVTISIN